MLWWILIDTPTGRGVGWRGRIRTFDLLIQSQVTDFRDFSPVVSTKPTDLCPEILASLVTYRKRGQVTLGGSPDSLAPPLRPDRSVGRGKRSQGFTIQVSVKIDPGTSCLEADRSA